MNIRVEAKQAGHVGATYSIYAEEAQKANNRSVAQAPWRDIPGVGEAQ